MKIKKVISRINRKIIFCFDGINTKLYMNKYNKWLKRGGVNIIGNAKYIHHTAYFDGIDYSKITIGNNVVLSLGVVMLIHDCALEAGMCALGLGSSQEAHYIKPISIGENTFVGARTIILGGATIGKNCIIGAGSVLTGKEYPDNSIIAGNPAIVIGNTLEWTKSKIAKADFIRGYYN